MKTDLKPSERLYELDGLRGIACLMVVVFHYSKFKYLDYDLGWTFKIGVTGVDLFFIISGFVIYMTLNRTNTLNDFVNSRITRLFPTYWFAVSFTALICIISQKYMDVVSIKNFFINLTMVPSWLNTPFIDNSYWTLMVELLFYIIIAFFYFYYTNISVLKKSLLFLLMLIIFNTVSIYFDEGKRLISLFPILIYWNLFFTGIVFYNLKYEKDGKALYYLIIAGNLIFMAFTHSQGGTAMYHVSRIEHIICDLIYMVLFYLLISKKLTLLGNKYMVFIGSISYSIYLIHQTAGYIFLEKFYDITGNSYIAFSCAFLLIIGIAYLLTIYIEKPVITWCRNKIKLLSVIKTLSKE